MRPIDADALIEELNEKLKRCADSEQWDEVMEQIEFVKNQPTIDGLEKRNEPVEPIEVVDTAKHVNDDFRTLAWKCGACGAEIGGADNYCHECGKAVKWE